MGRGGNISFAQADLYDGLDRVNAKRPVPAQHKPSDYIDDGRIIQMTVEEFAAGPDVYAAILQRGLHQYFNLTSKGNIIGSIYPLGNSQQKLKTDDVLDIAEISALSLREAFEDAGEEEDKSILLMKEAVPLGVFVSYIEPELE